MRTAIVCIVIGAIAGAIFYLERKKPGRQVPDISVAVVSRGGVPVNTEKAKKYELYKEISTPDEFINATSISVGEFIGDKVILLDIWTYSCINCQRTIPYLNAWHEKYKDAGLVIIGLHTPEFEFEKKYENVLAAVQKFGIRYPVVMDNDFSTWNAYGNRYWPRKYLIDIDGYIVYDHIGEGGYVETERKIQEALEERMARIGEIHDVAKDVAQPSGVASVVPGMELSPEVYFGSARNTLLGNGKSGVLGTQKFLEPKDIKSNTVYFVGDWDVQDEFAKNKSAGAKIIFRYRAKNVYMVTGADSPISGRVTVDGKNFQTIGFSADGLYPVVEGNAYGEHTLEITVDEPGLKVFTFTFG